MILLTDYDCAFFKASYKKSQLVNEITQALVQIVCAHTFFLH